MNLFIDTNVFLSFYHLTSEDLEELRKLLFFIEKKDIMLFITDQVVNEFKRNRENKIADAIKRLKEQKLNLQYPQICKDYGEYTILRALQKKYDKELSSLLKNILKDVDNNSLKADEIIDKLIDSSELIDTTDELIKKAQLRMDIGNPPGKKGSLGDAINWEALLKTVVRKKDIYIIADDGDYYSPLDDNKPKEFLINEWKLNKKSKAHFYRKLSTFFSEHYPEIKLVSEYEKDDLIKQFASSENFTSTHNLISKLLKYDDFSITQVNDIIESALSNTQIRWIISDSDVHSFLSNIMKTHRKKIDKEFYNEIKRKLNKSVSEDDEV